MTGLELKLLRVRAGLTQFDGGKLLDVNPGRISEWEKGRRAIPDSARDALLKIFGDASSREAVGAGAVEDLRREENRLPGGGTDCWAELHSAGLSPMKSGYTVSIRGEIPPDLQERISALHATAMRQPAVKPKKSRKTEEKPAGGSAADQCEVAEGHSESSA